jgi:predicted RNA-binding protein (TIGR00451 family)
MLQFFIVVCRHGAAMPNASLQKIRAIADYQFGRCVGGELFPDGVEISFSKRTGRIRHVYYKGRLLVTLRPTDGLFSLTVEGGRRMMQTKLLKSWVKVQDDVADFIAEGRSVFAKFVVDCDEEIRPQEEVVVVDGHGEVLAVGRAVLTGKEMKAFEHGVAVRTRCGVSTEEGKVKKEKKGS